VAEGCRLVRPPPSNALGILYLCALRVAASRRSRRPSPRRCSRGASVSAVSQRYGLHPSQAFAWRKAARDGAVEDGRVELTSVVIRSNLAERVAPPMDAPAQGRMEIVLDNGQRQMRQGFGHADAARP
jgi:transposase-like protein